MMSRRQAARNAEKSAEGVVVPVVQARSLPGDVLADVAARYGVGISAGCRAVAVPRGASGQVWRPNAMASLVLVQTALVVDGEVAVPGGAVGAEAYRRGVGRLRAMAKGPRAATREQWDRLRALHAQGLTDVNLGAALGVTADYAAQMRRSLGLPVHDQREAAQARAMSDTEFMGRIRAGAAAGRGINAMAVAERMCPKRLRKLMDAAEIVVVRVSRPKTRGTGVQGPKLDPVKDAVLAAYHAGGRGERLAAEFGVSRNTLHAALIRWGIKATPVKGSGALISNAVAAKAKRMVQLRALMAAGAGEDAIAAALGLRDQYHLRCLIRSVDPDYPLPRRVGQMNAFADRHDRILALHGQGMAVDAIAAAVGAKARSVRQVIAAGVGHEGCAKHSISDRRHDPTD
jgi:hypothetical protein